MDEQYQRDIMTRFPYPVARVFRKLRTDEYLDPGPQRRDQILATAEAVTRFVAFVVLCECRDLLERDGSSQVKTFLPFIEKTFEKPSWGVWHGTVREGLKLIAQAGAEPILKELHGYWFAKGNRQSEAADALEKLSACRNGLEHGSIPKDTATAKRLCEENYPLLCAALLPLAFLLNYRFVSCSAIEVTKRRRFDPRFHHRIADAVGTTEDFMSQRDERSVPLDAPALLLLEPRGRRCLNLDPLLVHESKAGRAPDIFCFAGGSRSGAASFVACNHGGEFNTAGSRRQEILEEEVKHLFDLFVARTGEVSHG